MVGQRELGEDLLRLDAGVQVDLDAQVQDRVDLRLSHRAGDHLFRELAQASARLRVRLEDGNLISLQPEIAGGGQARRSPADDGDPLLLVGRGFRKNDPALLLRLVFEEDVFQGANLNRVVNLFARAGTFARTRTGEPADSREGVVPANQGKGLVETARLGEGHVSLDADVGRTDSPAGCGSPLRDRKGARNRLGVELVDRLPRGQALFELARDLDGANLHTGAASGTEIRTHVAWLLLDLGRESAYRSLQADEFCIRDDVDVGVSSHLDQLRRDDAHGAVVRREGLVQGCHLPADGRGFLCQVDPESGVCQVEGGLNPRNPCTHDQNGAHRAFRGAGLLFAF